MDTEQNTSHGNAKKTDRPHYGKTDEELLTRDKQAKEMLEQVPIEGTPFTAVRLDDKWFLTMGKYRLTNELKTLEECKQEAKDASWHRIMQIMNIVIIEHEQAKNKPQTTTTPINQLTIN